MKIKLEVDEEGVWYDIPGVGRWEGQSDSRKVKWFNNSDDRKIQIIIWSEDDLDLDDENKKHRRLTLTLEEGP